MFLIAQAIFIGAWTYSALYILTAGDATVVGDFQFQDNLTYIILWVERMIDRQ